MEKVPLGDIVSLVNATVTGVAALPAASERLAVRVSAPSARADKLAVVENVPLEQATLAERLPLSTTFRPFSLQVPVTGKLAALAALT